MEIGWISAIMTGDGMTLWRTRQSYYFRQAMRRLRRIYAAIRMPWSTIYRIMRGLPVNSGASWLHCF